MSTAQRVSRGFHRLAVFLAAIPLIIGIGASIFAALSEANGAKSSHDEQLELICAQELAKAPATRLLKPGETVPLPPGKRPQDVQWLSPPPEGLKAIMHADAKTDFDEFDLNYDLKDLGCSEESRKVSWRQIIDASAPGVFSYWPIFWSLLS